MSSLAQNQKNVDFSRKCRDRVNFFFQKLKIKLKNIPKFQSGHLNWNRFEILERALHIIQIIDGIQIEPNEQTGLNRKDLNNKQLCQLYRTRLNLGFDKLRNILEEKVELRQFRLFSRAGLLEATIHYLERFLLLEDNILPKPNLKRERTCDENTISPNKLIRILPSNCQYVQYSDNLNSSTGFDSPDTSMSPRMIQFNSFDFARAQLMTYNRLLLLKNATEMAQNNLKKGSDYNIWRPW